jgi:phosphoribosylformylglycinamidine cyclo-ligase
VDLAGADRHVARIGPAVTATWGEQVIGGWGGFASGVTLPAGISNPVLMLTTDGVGTKLELARQTDRWEGVGQDLVAMVVDDLAAVGARAIGLVDYMAVGRLNPDRDATIVESIAAACIEAGCPLLGGETAEHPGVMESDQVDLAATALGVVERGQELGAHRVRGGDVVIGLASPNLRANGFSAVRAALADRDMIESVESLGLLAPSVIYSPSVLAATATGRVHAAAHITGGGLAGNLVRVLSKGLGIEIDRRSWVVPDVFNVIREWGDLSGEEMAATFNLGIGFCLLVGAADADEISAIVGHAARVIGRVVEGDGVRL